MFRLRSYVVPGAGIEPAWELLPGDFKFVNGSSWCVTGVDENERMRSNTGLSGVPRFASVSTRWHGLRHDHGTIPLTASWEQ